MPLAAFPKCFLEDMVDRRTMTNRDWVDLARDHLDVDGVELYWPTLRPFTDAQLDGLRGHADRAGLQLPLMCCSPDFTQLDRHAVEREVADEIQAIRATARLGGTATRVLSGQRRPEISTDQGIELTVSAIERVLPAADEYGVTVVMENHFRDYFWSLPEFAQASDIFCEIVDAIPDDAPFGVQFDPSNTHVYGEDPLALLERVRSRVVSVAASDRRLLERPGGRESTLLHGIVGAGDIDHEAIFAILEEDGFGGWITLEDGDDPTVGVSDLQASAGFVRRLMARHNLK